MPPRPDGLADVHDDFQEVVTMSPDDVAAMRKVVGYVARHTAQRPDGDVTETRWRYSLMNWGHDPSAT